MILEKYRNLYFSVDVLLSSSRALSDARRGVSELEQRLNSDELFLSDWKVQWAGICALLRASVHLFQIDAKACHNEQVKSALKNEWDKIKAQPDEHNIYWKFINNERNAILKEYHWSAYTQYLDEKGEIVDHTKLGLLSLYMTAKSRNLVMQRGHYSGRPCLEVLNEACDWVEERLASAVASAGYNLDDKVHFQTWARKLPEEIRPSLISAADKPE